MELLLHICATAADQGPAEIRGKEDREDWSQEKMNLLPSGYVLPSSKGSLSSSSQLIDCNLHKAG